jgi:hypothetical protein
VIPASPKSEGVDGLLLEEQWYLCQNRAKKFSVSLKTLLPEGHSFLIIIIQQRLENFSLRSFYD